MFEAAFTQSNLFPLQIASFLGLEQEGLSCLGHDTAPFLQKGIFSSFILKAHLQLQLFKSFLQALKIPLNLLQRSLLEQDTFVFISSVLKTIEEITGQIKASGSIENPVSQTAVQLPRKSLHAGLPFPEGQVALTLPHFGIELLVQLEQVALIVPVLPEVEELVLEVEPDVELEEVDVQFS